MWITVHWISVFGPDITWRLWGKVRFKKYWKFWYLHFVKWARWNRSQNWRLNLNLKSGVNLNFAIIFQKWTNSERCNLNINVMVLKLSLFFFLYLFPSFFLNYFSFFLSFFFLSHFLSFARLRAHYHKNIYSTPVL